MDVVQQQGGYDSGLGDEWSDTNDGCWAPPPSSAPSPEPSPQHAEQETSDPPLFMFEPTTLHTIHEEPVSCIEKISPAIVDCETRSLMAIKSCIRSFRCVRRRSNMDRYKAYLKRLDKKRGSLHDVVKKFSSLKV